MKPVLDNTDKTSDDCQTAKPFSIGFSLTIQFNEHLPRKSSNSAYANHLVYNYTSLIQIWKFSIFQKVTTFEEFESY